MSSILKRKLLIAIAALAAVAFAGGAYAANHDSGSNARQAFLNDVANRLHVTPAQLKAALGGAAIDQLSVAVKDGRLTQAQADAIKRAIQRHGGPLPGAPFMFGGRRFIHPFFGPRMSGGPLAGARMIGGPLAGAASYLGLTDAQLFGELSSGKSLAQIAQSRGKTVSGLRQAMVAAAKAKLDRAVAAKLISSAQEQRILAMISQVLQLKINRAGYGPRFGHFRGGAIHPFPFLGAPGGPPGPPGGPPGP